MRRDLSSGVLVQMRADEADLERRKQEMREAREAEDQATPIAPGDDGAVEIQMVKSAAFPIPSSPAEAHATALSFAHDPPDFSKLFASATTTDATTPSWKISSTPALSTSMGSSAQLPRSPVRSVSSEFDGIKRGGPKLRGGRRRYKHSSAVLTRKDDRASSDGKGRKVADDARVPARLSSLTDAGKLETEKDSNDQ